MATCEPGITLKYGKHKGRLLLPARVFVNYFNKGNNGKHFKEHYSNALYSDDHGKTWHPSAPFPETGTGEAGLVELSDGRIYYNSRTHTRPGNKRIAWSEDGGATWVPASESKHLPDGPPDVYGCKAGLLRLPVEGTDILVYSSPRDRLAKEAGRHHCPRQHRRGQILAQPATYSRTQRLYLAGSGPGRHPQRGHHLHALLEQYPHTLQPVVDPTGHPGGQRIIENQQSGLLFHEHPRDRSNRQGRPGLY